tara:strand:+ start:1125 stop:1289 length:165 start_codon:yes stop_codon:yes gene_type:complete
MTLGSVVGRLLFFRPPAPPLPPSAKSAWEVERERRLAHIEARRGERQNEKKEQT